jgi:hypothetical protein
LYIHGCGHALWENSNLKVKTNTYLLNTAGTFVGFVFGFL